MLLEVDNVSSGYGNMKIIYGVSIHIDKDEIVTVIGPNGSGKSTLLKTIFGLIRADEGKIVFDSNAISNLRGDEIARMGIGYVPQLDNIFPTLTVKENLEMGGYRLSNNELKIEEKNIFKLFPTLEEKKAERAITLSGGERQMLAIARSLITRPKLLLLDEPSASLAPNLVDMVCGKLKEIRDNETSILLVEQNARKSLEISDRCYVMVMGRIAHEGKSKEILNDKEINRLFLGSKKRKKGF